MKKNEIKSKIKLFKLVWQEEGFDNEVRKSFLLWI
jgi:hypothetical protein